MTQKEPVSLTSADGVTTITLDRPERKNAIDEAMWRTLRDMLQHVRNDADTRVVVLQGAGGDFCAGADVASSAHEEHPIPRLRRIGDVALALFELPMPVIAKVDGVAAGAGMNLALACDLVVASDRARFSQIFARRGLSIDFGGSWLLPRLIGVHKAKELVLLADMYDAAAAAEFGFVNRVVPVAELDAFVAEWASRLAAGPPIALSLSKRLLDSSFDVSFEQALDDEGRAQTVNISTKDTLEAISAFVEKRTPEFRGR